MSITTMRKPASHNRAINSLPVSQVRPSPENDVLYHRVDKTNPEFIGLVESVRAQGILEPVIVTADRWIVSGHRRYAAAVAAGLETVPVRILAIRRDDDRDGFIKLLREHNRQRVKTFDERLREELVSVDETDAYANLQEYRKRKSGLVRISKNSKVEMLPERHRAEISDAKMTMLAAAQKVIDSLEEHWPLSIRAIHYRIVAGGQVILRHANKPRSAYQNDKSSYKDLCNLLARARVAGLVAWEAVADETRPFRPWTTWKEPGAFLANDMKNFARGYWRDLLQSQPSQIEVVAEKLTVRSTVEKVTMHYTIPTSIGRGFSDVGLRHNMAERFKASGREKLIVILVGDLDADGEGIVESFARSMRDDFSIPEHSIVPIKAALRADQVKAFNLPPSMKAKESSSRFARFKERHGTDAWELEAMSPELLASELRKAIDSVIDLEAYEHEREAEAADARRLEGTRRAVMAALPGLIEGAE